ncbi:MAG: hypothetical protein H6Q59_2475 [Firmicutes bacterium]|nr:hypothetical protein [Bacillota bacterium]
MSIQFVQVSKYYGESAVFEDLNLTLLEGQFHGLMGASGSGKTTLANLLMGLVKPDHGEIKGIEGKRIAAVFQEDRLIEHWDAVKNIKLVCNKAVTVQMIEQELRQIGLEEYSGKPVREYSGGMRRRVAIVRALMAENDLLILDEPFKGLDEALKLQVMDYVKQKSIEKTVLLITHDLEEVNYFRANLITL